MTIEKFKNIVQRPVLKGGPAKEQNNAKLIIENFNNVNQSRFFELWEDARQKCKKSLLISKIGNWKLIINLKNINQSPVLGEDQAK